MLSQLEGALSGMQQSFRRRNRFKQLAMLVIARTTPVTELQGLRELFQRLDVDNSGLLSLDELRRGLRVMDSEVRRLPQRRFSMDEFRHIRKPMRRDELQILAAWLSRNPLIGCSRPTDIVFCIDFLL